MNTKKDLTLSPLVDAKSWRDAVCIVIDQKTKNMEPFSSGEVTKEIRENRPDLRFSHWDVGQYIRDLFFSNSVVYIDVEAYQVARQTTGKSRTPAGAEVFVYGPTYADALEHDFEVEIPQPAQDMTVPYDEYGTIDGEGPCRDFDDTDIVATVHADNRLCIPRAAFDKFMHESGTSIQLGDKVYIRFDRVNMKIFITLDKRSGAKAYDLTRDRGRVKYTPDSQVYWDIHDKFEIEVTRSGIEVDLSETI